MLYMVTFTINIPPMLAHIYTSTMDPSWVKVLFHHKSRSPDVTMTFLVVGSTTPLKNNGLRQIGSSSQLLGKIMENQKKNMFQTTNQKING